MVEVKGKKFTVILREEPEGGYSAQCLELPGAVSQGDSRKQALANIREAIEGYLEAFPEELDQLKRKRESSLFRFYDDFSTFFTFYRFINSESLEYWKKVHMITLTFDFDKL